MFAKSYVYILLYKDSQPGKIDHFMSQIAKERYAKEDIKASFKLQP
jgi:hypothetical protein